MTTWYADYVAVWDALVTLADGLKDTDGNKVFNSHVFYGEKYPPDNYPSCYVCPLPINVKPLTFLSDINDFVFDFGIVVNDPDPKQGYMTLLELVGKIYDALIADRTLSSTACGLEAQQIIPNWRGLGEGVEGHWIGLRIIVHKIRT